MPELHDIKVQPHESLQQEVTRQALARVLAMNREGLPSQAAELFKSIETGEAAADSACKILLLSLTKPEADVQQACADLNLLYSQLVASGFAYASPEMNEYILSVLKEQGQDTANLQQGIENVLKMALNLDLEAQPADINEQCERARAEIEIKRAALEKKYKPAVITGSISVYDYSAVPGSRFRENPANTRILEELKKMPAALDELDKALASFLDGADKGHTIDQINLVPRALPINMNHMQTDWSSKEMAQKIRQCVDREAERPYNLGRVLEQMTNIQDAALLINNDPRVIAIRERGKIPEIPPDGLSYSGSQIINILKGPDQTTSYAFAVPETGKKLFGLSKYILTGNQTAKETDIPATIISFPVFDFNGRGNHVPGEITLATPSSEVKILPDLVVPKGQSLQELINGLDLDQIKKSIKDSIGWFSALGILKEASGLSTLKDDLQAESDKAENAKARFLEARRAKGDNKNDQEYLRLIKLEQDITAAAAANIEKLPQYMKDKAGRDLIFKTVIPKLKRDAADLAKQFDGLANAMEAK